MDMDILYLVILGITIVSYLLGLFLSHFERKGSVSIASGLGNGGFINIFGVPQYSSSSQSQELEQFKQFQEFQRSQQQSLQQFQQQKSIIDDEII